MATWVCMLWHTACLKLCAAACLGSVTPPSLRTPNGHTTAHPSCHLKTRFCDVSKSTILFFCRFEKKFVSHDCRYRFCSWTLAQRKIQLVGLYGALGQPDCVLLCRARQKRFSGSARFSSCEAPPECHRWDNTFTVDLSVTIVFLHSNSLVSNYCVPYYML